MSKTITDYQCALAFRREKTPDGAERLICDNGAVITIAMPFPTGEQALRIRRNATKVALQIQARTEAEQAA
ncbi:MAG: hypothetical protein LBT88_08170 [Oscillospiraceae bacterium]|jgi:hypothetical protein|nr:hypothetical protein [Oscillospiraceae bacterium]